MSKPLYTGSEWDVSLVQKIWDKIDHISKNRFEYYTPQIEIISSEQMLDCYSSAAMPVNYGHWCFGKTFLQNERQYRKGMQGLAYEYVKELHPDMPENTNTFGQIVNANISHLINLAKVKAIKGAS